ncbi:MAG: hypothetical protein QOG83_3115, partial [Alphaproteobacteria bacterium]|nr:hypothetical protein [Alphaproteobacteria bacterium]
MAQQDLEDEALADRMDAAIQRQRELLVGANTFARAMSQAFSQSVAGGRQLDDVLEGLALRLSNMAVAAAFRPLGQGLASGLGSLFSNLFGGSGEATTAALGAIKPFAGGGVLGAPTYFPLSPGG